MGSQIMLLFGLCNQSGKGILYIIKIYLLHYSLFFIHLMYSKTISSLFSIYVHIFKPVGLDSQGGSRTRSLNLDLKDKLFFVLVEIFKIKTFHWRLCLGEIFVKIFWDQSRFVEKFLTLCRHFECANDKKSLTQW